MNKNLLKLIVACGTACFLACAAPQKTETEKWSERMARSEMKRFQIGRASCRERV